MRELVSPGVDRDRAIARIRERYQSLAARVGKAVEELRAIVSAHEPVELISSIVIPANIRFAGSDASFADATETVTWPAKIEYLVGVALSVPPGTGSTPPAVRAEDRIAETSRYQTGESVHAAIRAATADILAAVQRTEDRIGALTSHPM